MVYPTKRILKLAKSDHEIKYQAREPVTKLEKITTCACWKITKFLMQSHNLHNKKSS